MPDTGSDTRARPAHGLPEVPAHAYVPPPPPELYSPPAAWVDPDRSKGWIRRMLPVLRPYRRIMLGSLLASLILLGLQIAIPQVLRAAVDNALIGKSSSLTPYVWMLLALGVGQAVLTYVQRFGLQRASIEIEAQLRGMVFQHLGRLSFSFYDRVQSGQLISRANSDIRAIQVFLAFGPFMLVSMLSFLTALILMLEMHVLLTLVVAGTLPLVLLVGMHMRTGLIPISWLMQARVADIATVVDENVTGTGVVKSFSAEAAQLSLFEGAARKLRWASIQQVDNQARYAPLMQNLPRLGMAVLLLYGGYLVIHDELTLGTFLAFNSYVVMLQVPFMMIGFLMMMAQRAAASAKRVLEVLDERPDLVDRPDAVELPVCRGEVELRDVDFGYGDHFLLLEGFSLRLRPGETVAMVGRTGCGKSTVARLIPRFYDVRGGAVLIDGHDVRDLTAVSVRSHVGLVLDEPFLFSTSIRDNIAFGRPDASLDDVRDAARAAGADDFILELPDGYDTVVGERGYTLSGGQRQRIAIARTLLVNPRVLILDDATNSIDAQREHEIHGALRTLMRERTTLIIAHRLSTISLASRVVVMHEGTIVADGRHDELLVECPLYREILAQAASQDQAVPAEAADGPIGGGSRFTRLPGDKSDRLVPGVEPSDVTFGGK